MAMPNKKRRMKRRISKPKSCRMCENKITYTGSNTTSKAAYAAGSVASYASLLIYTFTNWLPRFLALVPELIYSVAVYDTF